MKSIGYSLHLFTSLVLFHSVSTIIQSHRFFFERAELKLMPNTGLKLVKFVTKKLNHTVIDLDVEVSLNRTYKTPFVHIVTYRQFSSNEYRKFLIDLWEDACKVMEGGEGNVFLKIIKGKINGNTNIFQRCPYTPGNYFITMEHLMVDTLNFGQILPSGRYRLEISVSNGFQDMIIAVFNTYLSISD